MATTDDDRGRQLERVLRLARRLAGQPWTPHLSVLAKDFDVSPRTIRRDLLLLERAGWIVPPRLGAAGDVRAPVIHDNVVVNCRGGW